MPFTSEEIRSLLLRYFREAKKNNPRFKPTVEKCTIGVRRLISPDGEASREAISDADVRRLIHVLWDLIFDRVLIPGSDEPGSSGGWPFLTITDHGSKVIEEARPIPYDPDGYLANLQAIAVGLHPTAFRYIEEAVATFRARCYLASAVMLGAASERIFTDLAESIAKAIADPGKQSSFRGKAMKGKMRQRVSIVTGWCQNNRAHLMGEWAGDERAEVIERLSHFIRSRRNDAGHPQDPPAVPSHEETYAALVVFPGYCKWIYELKTDLDARPGSI